MSWHVFIEVAVVVLVVVSSCFASSRNSTIFTSVPEVEGEIFRLRSQILMLSSPVFQQMLLSDMKEAHEGRIVLKEKLREEFRLVLPWLSEVNKAKLKVTIDSAPVCLRWADEYEIEELRATCEAFYLAQDPNSPAALDVAVEFGLHSRTEQCAKAGVITWQNK